MDKVKPAAVKGLQFLNHHWPHFVSTPEMMREHGQTDIRKRISELIAAGYKIEKERRGRRRRRRD